MADAPGGQPASRSRTLRAITLFAAALSLGGVWWALRQQERAAPEAATTPSLMELVREPTAVAQKAVITEQQLAQARDDMHRARASASSSNARADVPELWRAGERFNANAHDLEQRGDRSDALDQYIRAAETFREAARLAPVFRLVKALIPSQRARLRENPHDLEALVEMGNLNFQIQRYEAAVKYYRRALVLGAIDSNVMTDMGIALRRLGRIEDALEAFERAASLDDQHLQSRFSRALVLMMDKGDLPAAIKAFEAYLALGPNVPQRTEVMQQIEVLRQEVAREAQHYAHPSVGAPLSRAG